MIRVYTNTILIENGRDQVLIDRIIKVIKDLDGSADIKYTDTANYNSKCEITLYKKEGIELK